MLLLLPMSLFAQVDSAFKQHYITTWNKLIPNHTKLQFAGGMGTLSGSTGWTYGKHRQWETDFFLGFLRKTSVSPVHFTMTLKQTYVPFSLDVNRRFSVQPLTSSLYINKLFGEHFWEKLPERYPQHYYFWALNTRFNIALGQSITYKCSNLLKNDSFTFFYEFNTNDLYIISAIGNRYLTIKDIVNLSFGLKFTYL